MLQNYKQGGGLYFCDKGTKRAGCMFMLLNNKYEGLELIYFWKPSKRPVSSYIFQSYNQRPFL